MLSASERPPTMMHPVSAHSGHAGALPAMARMARPERLTRTCPKCESHSIARSRIRGFLDETARKVLGVRPYRCLDCWHRFMSTSRSA